MSAAIASGPGPSPEPAGVPRPPAGARRRFALPDVLLLDEGGVLSLSGHGGGDGDGAAARVAVRIAELIRRARIEGPDVPRIEADIRAGKDSYRRLKAARLADPHPPEIDHRHFWRDLVAVGWPPAARTLIGLEWSTLSTALSAGNDRRPAPGATDLLAWATAHGIRIGLVANTFAAGATRARLAGWGLDRYLSVQVHSDEIGTRKPDTRLLVTAMTALRADPARCWYVGDSRAQDVECARRAGVATAVLVDPGGAPAGAGDDGPDPDLRVRDCADLRDVLGALAARRVPSAGVSGEGAKP
jgi:FMN phosphatase YigB (HAD superfamily)